MDAFVCNGIVFWCGTPSYDETGNLITESGLIDAGFISQCAQIATETDVTGYSYADGVFTPPPTPPTPEADLTAAQAVAQTALDGIAEQAQASDVAFTALVPGQTLVNNFAPAWLGLITGGYLIAQANPSSTLSWQAENGWFDLSAAEVISLYTAGSTYLQSCFTTYKTLSASIAAATTAEEVKAIDLTVGWPATTY